MSAPDVQPVARVSLLELEKQGPLNDAQLALFDTLETMPAEVFESLEMKGEFTGARLFLQRPAIYRAIVTMIARGLPVRFVERTLRVSHNTIRAVCAREGVAIDTEKNSFVADLRIAITRGAAVLADVIGDIAPDKLPLAVAILIDKYLLLTGEATSRIETTTGGSDKPKTWDEWIEQMKRVGAAGMGLGGEKDGAKGEPVEVRTHALPVGVGAGAGRLEHLTSDSVSDARQCAGASVPNGVPDGDRLDRGAGGVALEVPGRVGPTHSGF